VLEVNAAAVVRFEDDATATIVGRHNRDSDDVFRLGDKLPAGADSALGVVLRRGRPGRIDDWGGREVDETALRSGYRSSAAAPIVVARAIWGAVGIASHDPLSPDAESRLAAFSELVSLAVASAQTRADLVASRARVVKAGDEQRRRLERNLHDGAQQRFVSVALDLRMARARLENDPALVAQLLDEAVAELDAGLGELREIARGLHPAVLTETGLARALEVLAGRLPIDVEIEAAPSERLPAHIEATAYYIVAEALTNVVRHADARSAAVAVVADRGTLRCVVSDDGRGGATIAAGTGILGLRDRAEAVAGTLTVTSPDGGGTVIAATLPLPG
jgi:signal transduction histidine kinase